MDRLPDLLESEARTRHYVDGELVVARRGINWPAGTTVDDDAVNERVDVNVSGYPVFAEDGTINGTTPSEGDVLSWDGEKIVWVTP